MYMYHYVIQTRMIACLSDDRQLRARRLGVHVCSSCRHMYKGTCTCRRAGQCAQMSHEQSDIVLLQKVPMATHSRGTLTWFEGAFDRWRWVQWRLQRSLQFVELLADTCQSPTAHSTLARTDRWNQSKCTCILFMYMYMYMIIVMQLVWILLQSTCTCEDSKC